jgi:hypothetical protein
MVAMFLLWSSVQPTVGALMLGQPSRQSRVALLRHGPFSQPVLFANNEDDDTPIVPKDNTNQPNEQASTSSSDVADGAVSPDDGRLTQDEIEATWGDDDRSLPSLEKIKNEKAKHAFARPWFYYEEEEGRTDEDNWEEAEFRAVAQQALRDRWFQDRTVEEVLSKIGTEEVLAKSFARVFINVEKVKSYIATATLEDLLDGDIIALHIGGADFTEVQRAQSMHLPLQVSSTVLTDERQRSDNKELWECVLFWDRVGVAKPFLP